MNGNEISVIGFFFTLVGLIGTYFYIHLGNWYNDVLNLFSKYDINEAKASLEQIAELRLCKFEYKKLFSWVVYLTTSINTIFIGIISTFSFIIIRKQWSSDDLTIKFLAWALISFLSIYVALTALFIFRGLHYRSKMKDGLAFQKEDEPTPNS